MGCTQSGPVAEPATIVAPPPRNGTAPAAASSGAAGDRQTGSSSTQQGLNGGLVVRTVGDRGSMLLKRIDTGHFTGVDAAPSGSRGSMILSKSGSVRKNGSGSNLQKSGSLQSLQSAHHVDVRSLPELPPAIFLAALFNDLAFFKAIPVIQKAVELTALKAAAAAHASAHAAAPDGVPKVLPRTSSSLAEAGGAPGGIAMQGPKRDSLATRIVELPLPKDPSNSDGESGVAAASGSRQTPSPPAPATDGVPPAPAPAPSPAPVAEDSHAAAAPAAPPPLHRGFSTLRSSPEAVGGAGAGHTGSLVLHTPQNNGPTLAELFNACDKHGDTILQLASASGSADVLELFLTLRPQLIKASKPVTHNTLLHYATLGPAHVAEYYKAVRAHVLHNPELVRASGQSSGGAGTPSVPAAGGPGDAQKQREEGKDKDKEKEKEKEKDGDSSSLSVIPGLSSYPHPPHAPHTPGHALHGASSPLATGYGAHTSGAGMRHSTSFFSAPGSAFAAASTAAAAAAATTSPGVGPSAVPPANTAHVPPASTAAAPSGSDAGAGGAASTAGASGSPQGSPKAQAEPGKSTASAPSPNGSMLLARQPSTSELVAAGIVSSGGSGRDTFRTQPELTPMAAMAHVHGSAHGPGHTPTMLSRQSAINHMHAHSHAHHHHADDPLYISGFTYLQALMRYTSAHEAGRDVADPGIGLSLGGPTGNGHGSGHGNHGHDDSGSDGHRDDNSVSARITGAGNGDDGQTGGHGGLAGAATLAAFLHDKEEHDKEHAAGGAGGGNSAASVSSTGSHQAHVLAYLEPSAKITMDVNTIPVDMRFLPRSTERTAFVLLQHGANKQCRNTFGRTPVDTAMIHAKQVLPETTLSAVEGADILSDPPWSSLLTAVHVEWDHVSSILHASAEAPAASAGGAQHIGTPAAATPASSTPTKAAQ